VKFSIEESDGVTAVSEFLKQKTLANYHIDKEIEVIYNFIDTERFSPIECEDCRQRLAPNGENILMHTSNFRPVKRVPDTIQVLKIVKEQGIAAKLVLIGDGPDRYECERLARELGLQKDVIFLGKQDCLTELLSAADIFLMPSQSESFGLAALEAMACGIPIVSSSAGGLPELNIHNQTGFIAELGDTEKIAKYTAELLTNEKKYAVFSGNCRRRALEQFDTQLVIPKYLAYYERILAK
jgi:N-acetyl-alpha-D-glucosaminyl L-malate synthase BshA